VRLNRPSRRRNPTRSLRQSRAATYAAAGLLALTGGGCASPERPADGLQQARSQKPPAATLWSWQRDLVGGGLDPDTRIRHALPQSLEAWVGASTIFREDFESHRAGQPDTWELVGFPDVRVLTDPDPQGAGRFVMLAGVPDEGPAGIAWELPASLLAGQTILCQLNARLANPWAARRLGIPRVEFLVESADGTRRPVPWPILDRSSPGWEPQQFLWSAPTDLGRVQLRLVHDEAVAAVGFDEFVLTAVDPEAGIGPRIVSRVGDNILSGGDFEVGVKRFSVTGAESRLPAEWYFDSDAALGTQALFIPLRLEAVRVTFGPVIFARTDDYVFCFQAKGTDGLRCAASLVGLSNGGQPRFEPVTPQWQRYQETIRVPAERFGRTGFIELLVLPPEQSGQRFGLWLDAVALSRGRAGEVYAAPNECELGIVDRWDNPLDLARVLHLDQSPSFVIRGVNYADHPRDCLLAIDITDGLDRVVASHTLPVRLAARSRHDHALKPTLPAGYYRILATLWPGSIGQGQPLSQAERSFVLCDLLDPVPRGAPCGMNVSGQFCSRRLTQLGIGWVRWRPDLRARISAGDFLALCREQALEVLLAGGQEAPEVSGAQGPSPLIGRELPGSSLPAGTQSSRAVELRPGRNRLVVDSDALVVSPSWGGSGLDGEPVSTRGLAQAVVFREEALPESIEPAVVSVRRAVAGGVLPPLWELAMPAPLVSNYALERAIALTSPAAGSISAWTDDPGWATSLSIRRYVLRQWAGVHRVALHTEPALGGIVPSLMAEYDHSPTPLVAALDFMNNLLNSAQPLAWFDHGEVRVLCFDRPDQSTVGVIWRPFGRRPTWVPLTGMAGLVQVRNMFGSPEIHRVAGTDLFVPASQYVCYLLCPQQHRAALLEALASLERDRPFAAPRPTIGQEPRTTESR